MMNDEWKRAIFHSSFIIHHSSFLEERYGRTVGGGGGGPPRAYVPDACPPDDRRSQEGLWAADSLGLRQPRALSASAHRGHSHRRGSRQRQRYLAQRRA